MSLNLEAGNALTFLKDFEAPPGVRHLQLNFEESFRKEVMLQIDEKFENDSQFSKIFEENYILLEFYQRIQRLDQLEAVDIIFNFSVIDQYGSKFQSYLLQSMLKRITSPLSILSLTRGKVKDEKLAVKNSYLP